MKKRLYLIGLVILCMIMSVACSAKAQTTHAIATDEKINYSEVFSSLIDEFSNGEISYEKCNEFYKSIDENEIDETITALIDKFNKIVESKNNFKQAMENYNQAKAIESYPLFDKVISDDKQNYDISVQKKKGIIDTYIGKSDNLAKGYFYDEAIANLEELSNYATDLENISERIAEYDTKKNELVLYEGEIRNIFFHSLIVFPELAFDGDWMEEGYNYWMTTVTEFKRMLEQMYERDFILIDVNMIYDITYEDDKTVIKKKELYLPKGKKPIILSLDDLNYYKYMKKDGFADRLVLDEEGNVATLTKLPDGDELIARDNDCVPILDVFVEKHPDFSFRNAKGIIGVTGYEGIIGYRTDIFDSPTYEQDLKEATAVANRLKETGWLFASHSYGHINFGERTMRRVKKDTKQWNDEVRSIVGETNLFIYPYGATVSKSDSRFMHLQENGFEIFFGVGTNTNLKYYEDAVLMDRCNLDGYKMYFGPHHLKDLFEVDYVYDESRPEFE